MTKKQIVESIDYANTEVLDRSEPETDWNTKPVACCVLPGARPVSKDNRDLSR
jgi:hypothetical protein